MKVSYFPGCTLRTKAKDLDEYARRAARALGIELVELDVWQCCGGSYVGTSDEVATRLSSVRALAAAAERGEPLVTVCSACHHVIKRTNEDIKNNPAFADKAHRYLAQADECGKDYAGETEVLHYLELLRDKIGFDAIRAAVKKPLTGKKVAAYYGCLLLRPNKVMRMDDPENPQIMEDLLLALGAEPVIYPQRNACCGGYNMIESPAAAKARSTSVLTSAANHGAEMIVTACPLCKYNLEKCGVDLPVVYLSELLAEALGVKEVAADDE